jgi:hypothetical protein
MFDVVIRTITCIVNKCEYIFIEMPHILGISCSKSFKYIRNCYCLKHIPTWTPVKSMSTWCKKSEFKLSHNNVKLLSKF